MIVGSEVQWGPVSEWFAGGATVFAVGGALLSALIAGRAARRAEAHALSEEQFRQRQEGESYDAKYRAVFAWCEVSGNEPSIVVRNDTAFPIRVWAVTLFWTTPDTSEQVEETFGYKDGGVLPPGSSRFPWSPSSNLPATDAEVGTKLEFSDANGVQVTRLESGILTTESQLTTES